MSSKRPSPMSALFILLGVAAIAAVSPGCSCNDDTSINGIACTGTVANECPVPLICDTAKGYCVDGRDDAGTVYSCKPPLPGCACNNGAPLSCLTTGTDPAISASCKEGKSFCLGGTYAACEPVPNVNCTSLTLGPGKLNPNPTNSDNVKLGPEGELLLDPDMKKVDFGYLWIANTGENTVSKIDVDTGDEVARYASVRDSAAVGVVPVPARGFGGDQSNCGNCPSRTAIDFNGDAFVANRAFNEQGSLTKFANAIADCVDRNGNMRIDTSKDLDNDKRIDKNDPAEFLGEADECILWTVKAGNRGGVPRGLAVDSGGADGRNGNVWVALFAEHRVIQLSGATGAPIMVGGQPVSVNLSMGGNQLSPYGAAIDGAGYVWLPGLENGANNTFMAKVNSASKTLEKMYPIQDDPDGCSKGYGISIDVKQRVWLGGWDCKDAKVFVPSTETWYDRDFNNESNTRGIAIDLQGDVWVAYTMGKVGRFRGDDVVAMGQAAPSMTYTLPPPAGAAATVMNNTIGVGVDRNGSIWAVSRNDSSPTGAITRILPTAGMMESFPVGKSPYTYSDFTGFGLQTVVRPDGFFRSVVEGCLDSMNKTKWRALTWNEVEPMGTSVKLRVRFADTIAGLDTAAWFGPFDAPQPPVNLMALGVPSTRFAQVEVQLSSTVPGKSPSFSGYQLTFEGCGTAIGSIGNGIFDSAPPGTATL